MTQIKKLLGDKADYLLNFNSPKISKKRLHIPGPDPLTNADTEARAKFYDRSVQALVGPYLNDTGTNWHNAGLVRDFSLSAFWMIYGAALLAVGFYQRSAFLRWQALILMAFTTVKVFLYDMQELDRVYRILSLIGLGVLLMAVSYVYQRDLLKLKKPVAPPPPSAAGGPA